MPTILTHPIIAAVKTWFPRVPNSAYALGAIATVLPDLDVVAFAVGIPYEHRFGHRGFSHSILFALIVAAVFMLVTRTRTLATFTFLFLCAMSHAVLDAMTTGGLGVAFFAPFSDVRHFLPWRPIRVSPIGPRFFSPQGLAVLASELLWVWTPCVALALVGKYVAHIHRKPRQER
jgi:inner membrane protein